VPTSVLLAVLAAAGLLALAPALVRRYDATERLVAERALSTARVLARAGTQPHRRRRTVPGRRPVNPPRALAGGVGSSAASANRVVVPAAGAAPAPASVGAPASVKAPASAGAPASRRSSVSDRRSAARRSSVVRGRSPVARRPGVGGRAPRRVPHSRAVYRRRRVFAALVLLNVVELVGVVCVGPGFWVSGAVTGALLAAYLVHLRNRALLERRRRRAEARYAAWLAARQAAVRREQLRRAAAKREALRQQLLDREAARREAARTGALRGRAYEARADRPGGGAGPGWVVNG
jgi:hypothetical protein